MKTYGPTLLFGSDDWVYQTPMEMPRDLAKQTQNDLLSKLTPKELDCLDRWLEHATAKEIARDLGISHHAVEKRLKSARTKLGVSSSLEAARLAAQREGYQRPVSQLSDLASPTAKNDNDLTSSPWMIGKRRLVMIVSVSVVLALSLAALQSANEADPVAAAKAVEAMDPKALSGALERSLEEEVAAAHSVFERMDQDQSGALEREEFLEPFGGQTTQIAGSSRRIMLVSKKDQSVQEADPQSLTNTLRDPAFAQRRATMFTLLDRDEDNMIDREEFTQGHLEGIGPRFFTFTVTTPQP